MPNATRKQFPEQGQLLALSACSYQKAEPGTVPELLLLQAMPCTLKPAVPLQNSHPSPGQSCSRTLSSRATLVFPCATTTRVPVGAGNFCHGQSKDCPTPGSPLPLRGAALPPSCWLRSEVPGLGTSSGTRRSPGSSPAGPDLAEGFWLSQRVSPPENVLGRELEEG